jgi:hypothetical protein
MSFFIKCVNPNYLRGVLYAVKDGKPHRLVDPRSLDRDWFTNPRDAASAKRRVERMYKAVAPSTKFRIERT